MPFDGSGNFNRVMDWTDDRDAGIKIRADRHDQEDDNFASGLSNVLCKDGQSQPTANLPMNGMKLLNLGAPTDPTDAATKAYADAIRNFNSAINLTGAVPESRIGFTVADIGFGARVAGTPAGALNRFVWNDKADFSGTDVMALNDNGILALYGPHIQIKPTSGNANIFLDKAASGQAVNIFGRMGDLTRWALILGNATAESGGNAGSDLSIVRYNDAGVSIGSAFSIIRSTGATAIGADLSVGGTITITTNLQSSASNLVLGATGGAIFLRPSGIAAPAGQSYIDINGNWTINGSIGTTGAITAGTTVTADSFLSTTGMITTRGTGAGNAHIQFQNNIGQLVGYCYFNLSANILNLSNNTGATGTLQLHNNGNMIISGSVGQKQTGTTWSNPSDERIKDVVGDYPTGLAEIMQLQPRVFVYKGNYTSMPPGFDPMDPDKPIPPQTVPYRDSPYYQMAVDGTQVAGFVAQEVEAVMPAMVTQQAGYIDGEPVDDLRTLDTSNLALAMVNAIKELATRVEALEAA